MKKTKLSPSGTSFFGHEIEASIKELTKILGEPNFTNDDIEEKVQYEWIMQDNDERIFTVYDWKEYRGINDDDQINWHIGAHTAKIAENASNELWVLLHPDKQKF